MLVKLKMLIAAAALSGSVSANVQAATIDVNKVEFIHNLSQGLLTPAEHLKDWNNFEAIAGFIHPGLNLVFKSNKAITGNEKELAGISKAVLKQTIARNEAGSAVIEPSTTIAKAQAVKEKAEKDSVKADPKDSVVPEKTETAEPSQAPEQEDIASTAVSNAAPVMDAPAEAPASEPAAAEPSPAPASAEPAPAPEPAAEVPAAAEEPAAKEITVKATAYTASCEGCSGITKIGIDIKSNPNEKVIAVDPSVIPLGSKVYVEGYGEAIAGDIGGAIKGNRIDVFIPSEQDAINFGVKQLKVKILN